VDELLMLDTNAVSAVVKGRARALARSLFPKTFCISVVTEAEIRFGIIHRPQRQAFQKSLEAMLRTIDIRPWTTATARRYAPLRAELATLGRPLAPLDLMIAAHAIAEGATLITADRAFSQVPGLCVKPYESA
jgi:tRNA(fMet)-specific endonuclease VapC